MHDFRNLGNDIPKSLFSWTGPSQFHLVSWDFRTSLTLSYYENEYLNLTYNMENQRRAVLPSSVNLIFLVKSRGVMELYCCAVLHLWSEQLRSLKYFPVYVLGVFNSLNVGSSEQAGHGMLYLKFQPDPLHDLHRGHEFCMAPLTPFPILSDGYSPRLSTVFYL